MSRPRGRFARSKARQGDILRHQIPARCPHSPLTGFTLIGALPTCFNSLKREYIKIILTMIMIRIQRNLRLWEGGRKLSESAYPLYSCLCARFFFVLKLQTSQVELKTIPKHKECKRKKFSQQLIYSCSVHDLPPLEKRPNRSVARIFPEVRTIF